MKRIIRGRQTGRTTELIQLCAKHGGYIVCRSAMVKRIFQQAKEMGLNIPYPLSYSEFSQRKYKGVGVRRVYIDDADTFLQHTFNDVEIKAISLLGENKETSYKK